MALPEGSSSLVRPLFLPSPARGEGKITNGLPLLYGSGRDSSGSVRMKPIAGSVSVAGALPGLQNR